jgi:UDP-4-amino-4,6-dideoxy-N-acetyl-beta-L-altrosamine transaminase
VNIKLEKFREKIFYAKHHINSDDISAVKKVLSSDYLTQGPIVEKFENKLCKYVGVKYAVAVNSATSALHLACLSLGVRKGDIVWTSANTFVSSANCALFCGAKIDFIDIDPETYNICIKNLEKKLIIAKKRKKLPKVIIPVHFGGQSCDMQSIYQLSKKYHFRIIEDASHAIGAKYKKFKVGSCRYSSFTIFSFHPVKIITTGEGGVALTNDNNLYNKAKMLSTHGITKNKRLMGNLPKNEIWNYKQKHLGFNYRITDIQAALGISQLKRINKFLKIRNLIAKLYHKNLKNLPIQLPKINKDCFSSYHLFTIRLKLKKIKLNQKEFFQYLKNKNINVNLIYIPVYRHPYYKNLGFKKNYCVEAEKYFKDTVSLPIYPNLKKKKLLKIISILRQVLIKFNKKI